MLNLKNVLYNFLYKNDGADGIADIIGSELGVNIALRRNFWWYRNILWASDLQVKPQVYYFTCFTSALLVLY